MINTSEIRGFAIFSSDDVLYPEDPQKTEESVDAHRMVRKKIPVSASVMATVPEELISKYAPLLREMDPGAHIDLVTHKSSKADDPYNLFGQGGQLDKIVLAFENGDANCGIDDHWIPYIGEEVLRQINTIQFLLNKNTSEDVLLTHASIHNGIHNVGKLYRVVLKAISLAGIPYRYEPRSGIEAPSFLHPDLFLDGLPKAEEVTRTHIINESNKIPLGGIGEFCTHLGEKRDQVRLLSRSGILKSLKTNSNIAVISWHQARNLLVQRGNTQVLRRSQRIHAT